jgi:hypothetical protein
MRNVQELLPHLAVYLGHVGPENTYWYVTSTPELLQTAAARFDIHGSKEQATNDNPYSRWTSAAGLFH